MKNIDFHIHTIYSDGTSTPKSILMDARISELDAIAICDHDHIQGYFDIFNKTEKYGIELIPGVEITTGDYHILGLGFNPLNDVFQNFLLHSRKQQEKNTEGKVKKLQDAGIPIDFNGLKNLFPESRLGVSNLNMYLMYNTKTRDYLKERGIVTRKDVLNFTRKFKSDFNSFDITPENSIREIKNAGGIAIIAHPFKDIKEIGELDYLTSRGLDGIEIQPNHDGKNEPFRRYAQEHNLIITYGSDYHGAFLKARPMLYGDEGQISEELLERLKINI